MSTCTFNPYDNSYIKRKKITIITALVMIVATLCVFFCSLAFADGDFEVNLTPDQQEKEFQRDVSTDNYSDIHLLYHNYMGTLLDEVTVGPINTIIAAFGRTDVELDGINKYFQGMYSKVDDATESDPVIVTVISLFQTAGLIMVFVYALIGMLKKIMHLKITMEMFAETLLLMAIAMICIIFYTEIINGVTLLGRYIISEVTGAVSRGDTSEARNALAQTFHNSMMSYGDKDFTSTWGGGLFGVEYMAKSFFYYKLPTYLKIGITTILFILFELPLIGVRVKILTVIIDIFARKITMPLAIANVASEGGRGSGVGALKKFLAAYLRVAMIVVVVLLANVVLVGILETEVTGDQWKIVFAILMKFICLFVIIKTEDALIQNTGPLADLAVGV